MISLWLLNFLVVVSFASYLPQHKEKGSGVGIRKPSSLFYSAVRRLGWYVISSYQPC